MVIFLNKNVNVRVGALGGVFFNKGVYVYVGSAQNSLEKRVKRHIRKEKKIFWHIDYLLNVFEARIVKVFIKLEKKEKECEIAQQLSSLGEGIGGFGCSDCKCASHLFRLKNYMLLKNNFEVFDLKKLRLKINENFH